MEKFLRSMMEFLLSFKFWGPIIYIFIGYLLNSMLSNLVTKIIKNNKRKNHKKQDTVIKLFNSIFKYIIIVIVLLMILELYGVNTKNIIASLGIFTVVIGLALQDTLKNMLAGILIILDNRYNVGDFVKINDFTGEVTSLGLQTTKLKSSSGEVFTISNTNITNVINYSEANTNLYYGIEVSYDTNIKELEKVLKSLIPKVSKIENVVSEMELLGVDSFNSSSITYKVCITTKPYKYFNVKREFNKILKEAFDKSGIEIPYNQLDVHIKESGSSISVGKQNKK